MGEAEDGRHEVKSPKDNKNDEIFIPTWPVAIPTWPVPKAGDHGSGKLGEEGTEWQRPRKRGIPRRDGRVRGGLAAPGCSVTATSVFAAVGAHCSDAGFDRLSRYLRFRLRELEREAGRSDLALQLEFLRRGYEEPLSMAFPGGESKMERKGERWTCMENVLDKRRAAAQGHYSFRENELVGWGKQVFWVFEAEVGNALHEKIFKWFGAKCPRPDGNGQYPLMLGDKFRLLPNMDRATYYCVDYDSMLWGTSWRYDVDLGDGGKPVCEKWPGAAKPVLLAMLGVLVAGLDTGIAILSGQRRDMPPNARQALAHMRQNVRLFNQIAHDGPDDFGAKLREEIGLDLGSLRAKVHDMLSAAESLAAKARDLAVQEELQWLRSRVLR